MNEVKALFLETRQWRTFHRVNSARGHSIESAACAIRERALLDALLALGMSAEEVKKLDKESK